MSPDPFGALTVERLDTSNYLIWAPRMEYFLTTKGLWEAVTTDDAPVADCRKARAIIGLCVTSQHLATIQRSKTAKEAWDSLAAIFKTKGTALKLRLRRDLSSFKMAAGEPLTKYFARAKALQDKLLESFPDFKEEDIFWPTVQGLPSTYDTILTIIENTADAELTLDSVLPKLMQVEQRQRGPDRPDRSNETALLAKPSFTFRLTAKGTSLEGKAPFHVFVCVCYTCLCSAREPQGPAQLRPGKKGGGRGDAADEKGGERRNKCK